MEITWYPICSTYKKDAGFAWQTALQAQEMATQQVTYGLIAYQRMAEGGTRLYDFTDVLDETDHESSKRSRRKNQCNWK